MNIRQTDPLGQPFRQRLERQQPVRWQLRLHLQIGDGAQVTAMSGVKDDIPAGGRWGGFFAKPTRQWFREIVAVERLARDGSSEQKGEGRD